MLSVYCHNASMLDLPSWHLLQTKTRSRDSSNHYSRCSSTQDNLLSFKETLPSSELQSTNNKTIASKIIYCTPYNHVLSHKTPNPSVLHLSIVISLKYHTQSIPICTQSQSQRVDAYCSTLRLCMVLHVKIAWLSLCSPPPYGVKEEEESVRVVTDSQRQLSLTSTSDDIRRLISRMNAVKVQKIA